MNHNYFRYVIYISFFLFFLFFVYATDCVAEEWTIAFGEDVRTQSRTFKKTPDGGFIIAGHHSGESTFPLLLKLDASGNIQWTKKYSASGFPESVEIKAIEILENGYIVAGSAVTCYTNEGSLCRNFGWLSKLDLNGNIIWQKGYEVEGPTAFNTVMPTGDGGFIAGGFGHALGTVTALYKPLVMKVDGDGNLQWRRFIDTQDKTLGYSSEIKTIIEVNSDSYFIGGHVESGCTDEVNGTGGSDIFVAMISGNGSPLWVKVYNSTSQSGSGNDKLETAKKTQDGFILAGLTGPWGYGDGFLMKIDSGGNIIWQKRYDDGISSGFMSIATLKDGGFLVGGLYQYGAVVIKVNPEGNIIWKSVYNKTNKVVSIDETKDGGFIALTDSNYGLTVINANGEGRNCLFVKDAEILTPVSTFVAAGPTLYLYPYYNTSDVSIITTKASAQDVTIPYKDICPKTLSVTFNGKGTVDINSSLFGESKYIRCTNSCNVTVDFMSDVFFYVYPAAGSVVDGYTFYGWSGDCSGNKIKMDDNKACVANFVSEQEFLFLKKGWNFVSFPKLPIDSSISFIMAGKDVVLIWSYDNELKRWLKWLPSAQHNNLTKFEFGKGYWIYMNSQVTIDMVNWNLPSQSSIPLYPGWNLTGWLGEDGKSVEASLFGLNDGSIILWNWDNGRWSVKHETPIQSYPPITNMHKKRAYWIKVKNQELWQQ